MPVRFLITIDTGNAAFEDDLRGEGRAIADRVAGLITAKIADGQARPTMHHAIRDTNGNLIGHFLAEIMPEPAGGGNA